MNPVSCNPYFYHIRHKDTGQFYFGFRYRNKKPAIEDIGQEYFTSSDVVSNLGFENFDIIQIKEFVSAEDAFLYEQTRIKENRKSGLILNKHFKDPDTFEHRYFFSTKGIKRKDTSKMKGPKSIEHCLSISDAQKANGGNGPSKHRLESRQKISQSLKGGSRPKWSNEQKKALSDKRLKTTPWTCVYCGKKGGPGGIAKWHNENCRNKDESKKISI